MARWIMKSEPDAYGWDDLVAEREGTWDGVRSHQAANNLRAMAKGDLALFYHSVTNPGAVGIAKVSTTAFPDPSDDSGKWVAVKVKPVRALESPVSLKTMRGEAGLAQMAIIRQSRLSVAPVSDDEWAIIMGLAGEKDG